MRTRIVGGLGVVFCCIATLTMIKSVQGGRPLGIFDLLVLIVDVLLLIACIRLIITK